MFMVSKTHAVSVYRINEINRRSYFEGGGFEIGAAQFYPKQPFVNLIVSHRVIFVMCEYRLGLFGFSFTSPMFREFYT